MAGDVCTDTDGAKNTGIQKAARETGKHRTVPPTCSDVKKNTLQWRRPTTDWRCLCKHGRSKEHWESTKLQGKEHWESTKLQGKQGSRERYFPLAVMLKRIPGNVPEKKNTAQFLEGNSDLSVPQPLVCTCPPIPLHMEADYLLALWRPWAPAAGPLSTWKPYR